MDKHIERAKNVCIAEKADGVIVVIVYPNGQHRTVSYGRTQWALWRLARDYNREHGEKIGSCRKGYYWIRKNKRRR